MSARLFCQCVGVGTSISLYRLLQRWVCLITLNYIYIYTHTHTHTSTYPIWCIFICVCLSVSSFRVDVMMTGVEQNCQVSRVLTAHSLTVHHNCVQTLLILSEMLSFSVFEYLYTLSSAESVKFSHRVISGLKDQHSQQYKNLLSISPRVVYLSQEDQVLCWGNPS